MHSEMHVMIYVGVSVAGTLLYVQINVYVLAYFNFKTSGFERTLTVTMVHINWLNWKRINPGLKVSTVIMRRTQ